MAEDKKHWWGYPISEFFLWTAPAFLAALGHGWASFKADMRGTGPGLDIALMNERTVRVQRLWHFVDAWRPILILYGLLLLGVCLLAKRRHVRVWLRAAVAVVLAVPGLWYFSEASYLGGKLLTLYP